MRNCSAYGRAWSFNPNRSILFHGRLLEVNDRRSLANFTAERPFPLKQNWPILFQRNAAENDDNLPRLSSSQSRGSISMSSGDRFFFERPPNEEVATEELLSDLRAVAENVSPSPITHRYYNEFGKYHSSTIARRFGSWNLGIQAAGLKPRFSQNYDEIDLFDNILKIWEHYGRQPRRSDLGKPPSVISQSPYTRYFGSWGRALKAFIDFANKNEEFTITERDNVTTNKTRRDPSLSVRFKVLSRDNFRCCSCGASPSQIPGTLLHVDHIRPWSLGGETTVGNLQTLCANCNLGKSNRV